MNECIICGGEVFDESRYCDICYDHLKSFDMEG